MQAALVENGGRLSSTNAIAAIRTVQLYEQPSTWGLPAVPQRWDCGRRRNCNRRIHLKVIEKEVFLCEMSDNSHPGCTLYFFWTVTFKFNRG